MSDEPRAPRGATDDSPPVFDRWSTWYALVAAGLLAMILLCGWLAAHNG